MLIRIVRMHFTETGVEEFLPTFQANMQAIRTFEGCTQLELLKDINHPLTYTTISYWNDVASLENYRKSELFAAVWKKVKTHFSRSAEAFSIEPLIQL